jgi:hypothetical protein
MPSKKKTPSPAPIPAAPAASPAVDIVDPTLETSSVTVQGREYTLCFDMRTLAKVERELRAQGHAVTLLESLPSQTLEHTLVTFAATLRRFHPEIPFVQALALPKMADIYAISLAIADAWKKSLPVPDESVKKNESPIQS